MGISLLLMDADTVYRSKLKDWLLVHPECGVSLLDSLEHSLPTQRNEPVILLLASGMPLSAACQRADTHVIALRDGASGPAAEMPHGVSLPEVGKYQPVPSLLQAIRHVAEEKGWTRTCLPESGRCEITLILHSGGCGHLQPIAPVLAALCAKGANTAVVSLDPVFPLECWYPCASGGGLSRLAFEVRGQEPLSVRSLEASLSLDAATGVHVIRSAELPQDAAGFDAAGVIQLKRTCGEANMDVLIVDAGSGLTDRNLDLLGLAGQVLLVGSADAHGMRCMDSAQTLCRELGASGRNLFGSGAIVKWLLMGDVSPGSLQPFSDRQVLPPFPVAYPDGFPTDPWEVSDGFLRAVHALVPGCGKGNA